MDHRVDNTHPHQPLAFQLLNERLETRAQTMGETKAKGLRRENSLGAFSVVGWGVCASAPRTMGSGGGRGAMCAGMKRVQRDFVALLRERSTVPLHDFLHTPFVPGPCFPRVRFLGKRDAARQIIAYTSGIHGEHGETRAHTSKSLSPSRTLAPHAMAPTAAV